MKMKVCAWFCEELHDLEPKSPKPKLENLKKSVDKKNMIFMLSRAWDVKNLQMLYLY